MPLICATGLSITPVDVCAREEKDDAAFGNWLSGFVDGEGCFFLGFTNRQNRQATPRASFSIALRDDDEDIIMAIHGYLKVGKIYKNCYRYKGRSDRLIMANPQTKFFVTKTCDLMNVVIPHFDTYPLRAKKRRDLALFKAGVVLIHEVSSRPRRTLGRGTGSLPRWLPGDLEKFSRLRDILEETRRYPAKEDS